LRRILASDSQSGFASDPSELVFTKGGARIIAFLEGYLDYYHFNEVMGGTDQQCTPQDEAAFDTIKLDLLSELYINAHVHIPFQDVLRDQRLGKYPYILSLLYGM
jgi:hypothetical protein